MFINKKIASAVLTIALVVQSLSVSFAFSDKSHMLNRVTAQTYEDFANEIQNLIDEYDDEENYLGSIEMQIGSNKMVVDGVSETIDSQGTKAAIYDGSTMIPARALAEALGCEVGWDGATETVEITGEGKKIEIPIGEANITVNGQLQSIPAAARVVNDRTLVPARQLCEALGCEVEWEDSTQTVTITRNFQTKRLIVKPANSSIDFTKYGAVNVIWAPGSEYAVVQFATEDAAINAYNRMKKDGSVLNVEPDVVMMNNELMATSRLNDPWDTDYTQIVNFANSIDSPKTMKIAVFDSGASNVSILSGKILGGINCIGSPYGTGDVLGHGTAVAGIIAKSMGDVDFRIIPMKITDTASFNMTASVFGSAIQGCIEKKADVINLSISIPYSRENFYVNDAIEDALNNNISVVAAAGNFNDDVVESRSMLASREDVVVVGSSNRQNGKSPFSSYGSTVDISAPGERVMSIATDGSEKYVDGTSFSSPHVAAAVALIRAKNPSFNTTQVENELKKNVTVPNGWDTRNCGKGILHFNVSEAPKKISASNITVQENGTAKIIVTDSRGTVIDESRCTYTCDNTNVAAVSGNGVVMGKKAGSARIKIKTKDADGLETSIIVTVTSVNEEPTIIAYEWSDGVKTSLKVGETTPLSVFEVYSDGASVDVTNRVAVASSDTNVAIFSNGTIKAISAGTTNITLASTTSGTVRFPRSIKINVTAEVPPEPQQSQIVRYEWSGGTATRLEVNGTTTIKLNAIYSDGQKVDVTKNSGLYSTNEDVVTINSSGKIKAVGKGEAKIMQSTIAVNAVGISMAPPFSIIVTGVELEAFEWSKSTLPDMEIGDTTNIKLYAIYSDGNKNDVTQSSDIHSTNEDVVTVDSNGKIMAVGSGTATIVQGAIAIAERINVATPIKVTVIEPTIQDNPDFEYDSYGDGVAITGYTGSERYLTIPETLGGEDVVAIADSAFKGNKNISTVSMPSSIEEIGEHAFANCKSLKTVHFSASVSEIGAHAFDDCTSLTGVTLPSKIREIAAYTFRGCAALKKIKIPAKVSYIGEHAFANCRSLSITIPDSVEEIASSAFTSGNSIKISGSPGSVAESYAAEKGFSFN